MCVTTSRMGKFLYFDCNRGEYIMYFVNKILYTGHKNIRIRVHNIVQLAWRFSSAVHVIVMCSPH